MRPDELTGNSPMDPKVFECDGRGAATDPLLRSEQPESTYCVEKLCGFAAFLSSGL
jgi:hypothetical protein